MSIEIHSEKIEFAKTRPYKAMYIDILDDTRISPLSKLLLIRLNGCDKDFKPSRKGIATLLGYSESAVDVCKAELKANGYITSIGERNSTEWTLHLVDKRAEVLKRRNEKDNKRVVKSKRSLKKYREFPMN